MPETALNGTDSYRHRHRHRDGSALPALPRWSSGPSTRHARTVSPTPAGPSRAASSNCWPPVHPTASPRPVGLWRRPGLAGVRRPIGHPPGQCRTGPGTRPHRHGPLPGPPPRRGPPRRLAARRGGRPVRPPRAGRRRPGQGRRHRGPRPPPHPRRHARDRRLHAGHDLAAPFQRGTRPSSRRRAPSSSPPTSTPIAPPRTPGGELASAHSPGGRHPRGLGGGRGGGGGRGRRVTPMTCGASGLRRGRDRG